MFINLKKIIINYMYRCKTKVKNVDADFWGDLYLKDLESDFNV